LWYGIVLIIQNGDILQSVNNLDNTIISWEKIYHANVPKEEEPKK
jgi:cAMP-specific phosphodiesterase 4